MLITYFKTTLRMWLCRLHSKWTISDLESSSNFSVATETLESSCLVCIVKGMIEWAPNRFQKVLRSEWGCQYQHGNLASPLCYEKVCDVFFTKWNDMKIRQIASMLRKHHAYRERKYSFDIFLQYKCEGMKRLMQFCTM